MSWHAVRNILAGAVAPREASPFACRAPAVASPRPENHPHRAPARRNPEPPQGVAALLARARGNGPFRRIGSTVIRRRQAAIP